MKKPTRLLLINGLLITALATTFIACNNKNADNQTENKSPEDVAEEHNDAKFDKDKEKDAQFVVDATIINLKEIRLSELAQSRSTASDVKDLAKMMIEDHTKALKEVQDLATKKMITIPTALSESDENDYKKLYEKTGNDFDKAYCDAMVDGHKDAIDKFDNASTNAVDSDIRSWAAKMLPALRAHLDHAMMCSDKRKDKDGSTGKVTTTKPVDGTTTTAKHRPEVLDKKVEKKSASDNVIK